MLWQVVGPVMAPFKIKLTRVLKMQCSGHGANWLPGRAPSIVKGVTILFQNSAAKRFLEFGFALHVNPLSNNGRFIQSVLIAAAARTASSDNLHKYNLLSPS